MDFTLTRAAIQQCPTTPVNGQFLVLTFDVQTFNNTVPSADGLTLSRIPNYLFNPNNFSVREPDGTTVTRLATAPAYSCAINEAPSTMLPQSRYSLQVALDVPKASGNVILNIPEGGWEWRYPG
ncbi:hypothetical protein [Tsukamurella pulmonis]|uniref:hypothetical protein n=1 Tax=Tsukamurella pulmonis TaxID=47312 RepID=UPI0011122F81|nr:hypothetical protein [Tsukamurella pulmonis]